MTDTALSQRFDRIVREYGPALSRLAAAYTRDDSDRDDLLQDTWLAVWQALARFRGESSERTFIFRIAHNRAITFITRRPRYAPLPDADMIVDPTPDPAAAFACAQRHDRLLAAVAQLPEPQRQAVMLHLEDLSNREIAEVQGTTENNVAVRLTRARKALQALLGESEEDD